MTFRDPEAVLFGEADERVKDGVIATNKSEPAGGGCRENRIKDLTIR